MKKSIIFPLITLFLSVALMGCSGVTPAQPDSVKDGLVQTPSAGKDDEPSDQTSMTPPADTDVEYVEATFTQNQNKRKQSDTATVNGITYSVLNIERTQAFGSRNLENLSDWIDKDAKGGLSGDDYYVFLTIQFTNTTNQKAEILRNQGGIYAISSENELLAYGMDAVYYDEPWTAGKENETFHWVLEPNESITSEIGWFLHNQEETMGSYGLEQTWSLYYGVTADNSPDHKDSLFIDLEMGVD